jgi:hypothetical protein
VKQQVGSQQATTATTARLIARVKSLETELALTKARLILTDARVGRLLGNDENVTEATRALVRHVHNRLDPKDPIRMATDELVLAICRH